MILHVRALSHNFRNICGIFFQNKTGDNIRMLYFSQTEQEQYRVLHANVLSSTMRSCFVVRARIEILTTGFRRVCLHPTHRAIRHILPAKRQPSCLGGAMLPQGSGSAGCNNITHPRERALFAFQYGSQRSTAL